MIKFIVLAMLIVALAGCGDPLPINPPPPAAAPPAAVVETPQQIIERLTNELSNSKTELTNQVAELRDFKQMYGDTLQITQLDYARAKAQLDETLERKSVDVAIGQACAWGISLCPWFVDDKQYISIVVKKSPVLTSDGTLGIGDKTYNVNANPYVFYEVIAAKFAVIAVFIVIVTLGIWLIYEKRAKHTLEDLTDARAALKNESAVAAADKAEDASLKKIIADHRTLADTLATSNKTAQTALDEKIMELKKIQDDIDRKQRGLDLM